MRKSEEDGGFCLLSIDALRIRVMACQGASHALHIEHRRHGGIVCHSLRTESGTCIVFELVGHLADQQMGVALERRRAHERHSFCTCFYHWSGSAGLWSGEWSNLMEVSYFLSIQRVWYIGTFVLRASSIGSDSVRLARSGLNQVGLQHFF